MTLNEYEKQCLEAGTIFTAVRIISGKRSRKDFDTIEAAQEYAAQFDGKRTMIYAVTKFGNSAHICNF